MKFLIEVASKEIGINLWPAPQISEHCPIKVLGRLIISIIWFIRPGVASALIPKEGIVQECSTSFDVTIIRVGVWIGTIKWFEVSIRRFELDLMIREEKFISLRFEYWYAQFHWNPILLIEINGLMFSSIK